MEWMDGWESIPFEKRAEECVDTNEPKLCGLFEFGPSRSIEVSRECLEYGTYEYYNSQNYKQCDSCHIFQVLMSEIRKS